MNVLSVCTHGGYEEEDDIADLELVKIIKEEGKKMGATDFFIGNDLEQRSFMVLVS